MPVMKVKKIDWCFNQQSVYTYLGMLYVPHIFKNDFFLPVFSFRAIRFLPNRSVFGERQRPAKTEKVAPQKNTSAFAWTIYKYFLINL
jgi:hypothetical protein